MAKKKSKKKIQKKSPKIRTVQAEIMESTDSKSQIASIEQKQSTNLVPSDPLTRYMTEIRKYPLLTKEEEHKLALRFKETGDPLAAEKLVTSNLRFVVKVASEYSKLGAKMMDLVQEGNVGLMHAVKEFNPYKGVRLITYAVWWIRGHIREYLLKSHSIVKIGTTQSQKKLFYQLEKEIQKLERSGQRAETALISQRLDVPEKDVETMRKRMRAKDLSLDQPIDDENKNTLMDLQTDTENTPEAALESSELISILHKKVDLLRPKLNKKEIAILENRVLSEEPLTLQQIGDQFGITRERARQLEARLIKNLKESFFEEY